MGQLNKVIITIAILFCFKVYCIGNPIDTLNTKQEVEEFIKLYFKDYLKEKGFTSIEIADSSNVFESYYPLINKIGFKFWDKGDFDNNGETDLLVSSILNSEEAFQFILLSKNNQLQLISIPNSRNILNIIKQFPVLLPNKKNSVLIVYDLSKKDTLVLLNGILLEESLLLKKNTSKLDSIVFKLYGGCEGKCYFFDLNLSNKGEYSIIVKEIDKIVSKKKGKSKNISDKLFSIFNKVNLERLNNKYSIIGDDLPIAKLEFYRKGTMIKTVEDEGMKGNIFLMEVYQVLQNYYFR